MPVPATIDDLSPTAGSNSPAGGETPKDGDNYIRAHAGFIAELRDKLDGTSDTGTIKNATFSGTTDGLRVPLVAYKTGNTARTSTITVSDDPHLTLALGVGVYAFQLWLPFWASTTTGQGIRLQFAYSGTVAGPSYYTYDGAVLGSQVGSQIVPLTTLYTASDITTSSDGSGGDALFFTGVINSTIAGTLSLKWAQESSSINATTIGSGAWLTCTKIS